MKQKELLNTFPQEDHKYIKFYISVIKSQNSYYQVKQDISYLFLNIHWLADNER